jgi:hypothetical protein
MLAKKFVLAAAALAALTAAGLGSASAQPRAFDRDFRDYGRYEQRRDWRDNRRAFIPRHRVYDTLRMHRFVGLGNPYFLRGQYVVRSYDRFGRVVLVRIDPFTGRFLGVVRI